jgi:hypothetical protein
VPAEAERYDRALLLQGAKRNEVLTLEEVERYGRDSFGDADYVSIYGLRPREWYARGVRLLGRTAVECTRDVLGDAIGREIAREVGQLSSAHRILVVDPFAGSCNTLHWILRHLPESAALGFELDSVVFELTHRNLAILERPIELRHGDYETLLAAQPLPADATLVIFVAPPWGTALDEKHGLDLRRTTPPITEMIDWVVQLFPDRPLLFAVQVYEKVDVGSIADLQRRLDRTRLEVFNLNSPGRNHGVLVGTHSWAAASS